MNLADETFANISAVSGFDWPDDCRAVAKVDWDFDGNTDVMMTNRNGPNIRFLRNTISTSNHFVGFRLEGNGVSVNRDAVGARVELVLSNDGNRKRIKTIRVGEGFQSQSSRWVKFGIGENIEIEKAIVRWPDSSIDEYSNIKADRWFILRQAESSAEEFLPPSIDLENKRHATTSQNDVAPLSTATRTLLTRTVPFPSLAFDSFDGQTRIINRNNEGKGTLIVLWATWCPNCIAELIELQARSEELRAAGIEVVALCVDALGDDRGANAEKARAILNDAKVDFAAGPANAPLMELLHIVDEFLFDRPRSLPVPSSFLLNSESQLVATYKGPITPDQLLADARTFSLSDEDRQRVALPFAGTWSNPEMPLNLMDLAMRIAAANRLEVTEFYLREILEDDPLNFAACMELCDLFSAQKRIDEAIQMCKSRCDANPESIDFQLLLSDMYLRNANPQLAEQLLANILKQQPRNAACLVRMGHSMADRGELPNAIQYYQDALAVDDTLIEAHAELARVWAASQQTGKSIDHLTSAIVRFPEDIELRLLLADIHVRNREFNEAISLLQTVLKQDDTIAAAHFVLGRCLENTNNNSQAEVHFELALHLDPRNPMLLNQWGIVLAKHREFTEAIRLFKTALEIDPNFKPAADNLAQAERFKEKVDAPKNPR